MISSSNDRPTAQTAATCILSGLTILSIIFISIAIQGGFRGLFTTKDLISHYCQIARTCIKYVRNREIADDHLTRGASRKGGDPSPQPGPRAGPGGGAAPGPVGIELQDRVQFADIRRNAASTGRLGQPPADGEDPGDLHRPDRDLGRQRAGTGLKGPKKPEENGQPPPVDWKSRRRSRSVTTKRQHLFSEYPPIETYFFLTFPKIIVYSLLYVDDEPGLLEIGRLFLEKGGDIQAQFADLAHKIKRAIERRRVGEALAGNRNYLDQIFSSVREGLLIIDAETHLIIDLNPAAAGILGSTRDRILQRCSPIPSS